MSRLNLRGFSNRLKGLNRRNVVIVAIAVVGLITLLGVSANSFSLSIEPEDGAGASLLKKSSSSASNGEYIKFAEAQPGEGLDFPANSVSQQSSVSQWGITWSFDKPYSVGKYANGDWWVVGPITLSGISPTQGNGTNGANINPTKGQVGYDKDLGAFQSLSFPRTVQPGSSIVKGISRPGGPYLSDTSHRGELQTAAVLTVVSEPPPKNGAIAFRPAYFGSNKKQYLTTDLRVNLLPDIDPPPAHKREPTQYGYSYYVRDLGYTANRFQRLQLDHATGDELNRRTHPVDNMRDYGGRFAVDINDAIARLMLDDPISEKAQTIINLVQYGIDLNEMYKGDAYICADSYYNCGGHGGGRGLALLFAATLLNASDIKNTLDVKQDGIPENYTLNNRNAVVPLYGDKICSESEYWGRYNSGTASGAKTCRDPYGWVDGGWSPGASYQGVVTPNWRGTVLFMYLVPQSQSFWPSQQREKLLQYMDRASDFGAWTLPDPTNRRPEYAPYHGRILYMNNVSYISPLTESLWIDQNLSQRITTDWANL